MGQTLKLVVNRLLAGALICSSMSNFLLAPTVWAQSPPEQAAEEQHAKMLQGQAAAFGVLSDEIQTKMGFSSVTDNEENVVISNITKGTAASDCGLRKGDLILDAQVDGSALDITIKRDGKVFNARLRAVQATPVFVVQKAKLDNTPRKPFTLNAEQTVTRDNQLVPEKGAAMDRTPKIASLDAKRFSLAIDKNAKLLADYNLELIVDRSNSMHTPDCPGGLSRWAWCGEQAGQLSKVLAPFTPNGLTIIPFATEYDVFEHATPQNIDQLFNALTLQQGTRLFEPLTERLDDYFVHHKPNSKPLLIVVVTDGIPSPKFEPALVKNTLIEASQKMTSQGEVTVIFCQIGGDDRFGQRYLMSLDENLVNDGAKYHFVHAIPFEQLQQIGLGPALVASINEFAPMKPVLVTNSAPKPKISAPKVVGKAGGKTAYKPGGNQ